MNAYCECGCGQRAARRFVHGHNSRVENPGALPKSWKSEDRGFDSECWIWQGRHYAGRSEVLIDGVVVNARAWVYEQVTGSALGFRTYIFLCNEARCVNPEHVERMSKSEWSRRRRRERKDYKPLGYEKQDRGFETNCWIVNRGSDSGRHQYVWHNGKSIPAHRYFYLTHVGPLKADEVVHHRCRVKACVNPEHLQALTPLEHTKEHQADTRAALHANMKISDSQVAEIRRRYAQGNVTQLALAEEYGVQDSYISRIITGVRRG